MLNFEGIKFLVKWRGFKGGSFRSRGIGFGHHHSDLNSSTLVFQSDLLTVFSYLLCSIIFLLISAYLAQIELFRLPKNPLRWHLFVMAELMNPSDKYEKSWLNVWWLNMLFWWLSFILLGMSFVYFLSLFTYKETSNSLGW